MKTSLQSVLDFTDQVLFIGIDVHKKLWVVTLRMGQLELHTFTMDPSPEQLARYVCKHYPKARYVSVYEAGCFGFWIDRRLKELGIENRVVHSADVPTSDKERAQKEDRRDSRKLARELENGSLRGIYTPSLRWQHLRSLWRFRERLISEQTRHKNRIKGFFALYGYQLPDEHTHWSRRFLEELRRQPLSEPAARTHLAHLISALEQVRDRLAEVTRELYQQLQQETPLLARWMSLPGIGRVIAIGLCCELIDPGRFKNIDHLCSYAGLIPSTRQSGEREDPGRLTRRRNRYLRTLLIEAAWVAIRKDPAFTEAYLRLRQRMNPQEAIIRMAKKLLRRVWSIARSQWHYEYGVTA